MTRYTCHIRHSWISCGHSGKRNITKDQKDKHQTSNTHQIRKLKNEALTNAAHAKTVLSLAALTTVVSADMDMIGMALTGVVGTDGATAKMVLIGTLLIGMDIIYLVSIAMVTWFGMRKDGVFEDENDKKKEKRQTKTK